MEENIMQLKHIDFLEVIHHKPYCLLLSHKWFFFSLLSTYDGKMYRNISLSLVHIMEFQYAPNQNHNPSRQNKKSAKNRGINCTFLKKRKKKGAFKEHQFLNFSPL